MSIAKPLVKTEKRRPHRWFVCVGKTVLYYPSGNTQLHPLVAFVEKVGESGVDLLFRSNYSEYLSGVSGCRHVDDRSANEAIRMESGGWDFTEDDVRLYLARPELGMWPEELEAEKLKKAEQKVDTKAT